MSRSPRGLLHNLLTFGVARSLANGRAPLQRYASVQRLRSFCRGDCDLPRQRPSASVNFTSCNMPYREPPPEYVHKLGLLLYAEDSNVGETHYEGWCEAPGMDSDNNCYRDAYHYVKKRVSDGNSVSSDDSLYYKTFNSEWSEIDPYFERRVDSDDEDNNEDDDDDEDDDSDDSEDDDDYHGPTPF